MEWTREAPTEPGWYWYQWPGKARTCTMKHVYKHYTYGTSYELECEGDANLGAWKGMWYGPLTPPPPTEEQP